MVTYATGTMCLTNGDNKILKVFERKIRQRIYELSGINGEEH